MTNARCLVVCLGLLIPACGDDDGGGAPDAGADTPEARLVECTDFGATREAPCGPNGRGSQPQRCEDGAWQNDGRCTDDDACSDGTLRELACGQGDLGTATEVCSEGAWTQVGGCVADTSCEDGDERLLACGVNGRGVQRQRCASGAWKKDGGCVDPDECEDGDETLEACGYNGKGDRTLQCVAGVWTRASGCDDPDECEDGTRPPGVCDQLCVKGDWVQTGGDVRAITAGYAHSCALHGDGTLSCWGSSATGALGNGLTTGTQPAPAKVLSLDDVRAVSAGEQHTCAVRANGTVHCFGADGSGQLGNGATTGTQATPVQVVGISDAVDVASGAFHTCALRATGAVKCWGADDYGQLGNGATTGNQTSPVDVQGLTDARRIVAGGVHTCAIRATGQLVCWGWDSYGQLGDGGGKADQPAPVNAVGMNETVLVAAGTAHTCAMEPGSSILCWGADGDGQLGNGDAQTADLTQPQNPAELTGVTMLAAGANHTCALRGTGRVLCWGADADGQLGDGDDAMGTQSSPVLLPDLADVVALAAGSYHTCALRADGTVSCFGSDEFGQLGDGDASSTDQAAPVGLAGQAPASACDAVSLAAGDAHTCAARANGSLRCFGNDRHGQLGNGRELARPQLVPTDVVYEGGNTAFGEAVSVSAGDDFTCALDTRRIVTCWGRDQDGQLGNGSSLVSDTEAPDMVTAANKVLAISAGAEHACALFATGLVKCWGSDGSGQLGNGAVETENKHSATDVVGLADATALSSGRYHTCAVRANGTLVCWGSDDSGQLGDGGVKTNQPEPVAVTGITDAVAVAAGQYTTCALRAGGSVACWGSDFGGRLGDGGGSGSEVLSPVAVVGLTDVISLAQGAGGHMCAVRANGELWCWGTDTNGELGNGESSTDAAVAPALVPGLGPVRSAVVGDDHSCVVLASGKLFCWGSDLAGQLGNGQSLSGVAHEPTPMLGVDDAVQVSAGADGTCVVRKSGAVVCAGTNINGRLGIGDASIETVHVPTPVAGVDDAAQVVVGAQHMCVRRTNGRVRCAGWDDVGRLGNGPALVADQASPSPVTGLDDATDVDANYSHSCAVRDGGSVACWGSDASGKLGNGDVLTVPQESPSMVEGLSSATAVATAQGFSCAIHDGGKVACWGTDADLQLGNDEIVTADATSPVDVAELSDATGISAGGAFACALRTTGQVVCWGSDDYGSLGNGPELTDDRGIPYPVVGLDDATQVSVGYEHACALRSSGQVVCWGDDGGGMLGNGWDASTLPQPSPVPVAGLSDAISVSAGLSHSCAIRASGAVVCWGTDQGRLGNGLPPASPAAVYWE